MTHPEGIRPVQDNEPDRRALGGLAGATSSVPDVIVILYIRRPALAAEGDATPSRVPSHKTLQTHLGVYVYRQLRRAQVVSCDASRLCVNHVVSVFSVVSSTVDVRTTPRYFIIALGLQTFWRFL